MVALGYVKSTYPDAVVAREGEYPTGLPTDGAGVAIPHCDASQVIVPTLAVATLAEPVLFGAMGGGPAQVPVEVIIMLAINDPSAQLDVLRQISNIVQNPALLRRLKHAGTDKEVIQVLREVGLAE
jgi:PTS system galactitol-specific IIA component